MSGSRELAKAVQKELADANTVAEESLSSMTTVRAHAAEDSARAAYQACLKKFYTLQVSQVSMWQTILAAVESLPLYLHGPCCWSEHACCAAVEGGPCLWVIHDLHNLLAERCECCDTVLR